MGSYATIENTKKIYFLSEKETHPNLIISFVNSELSYSNSSNGIFDILTIQPTIEVYNTKRSDYPARILSVKSKIFDEVIIADINLERAELMAAQLGAVAKKVDVNDTDNLREVMTGSDVVVNVVGPFFQYAKMIMEIAIWAK